MKCYWRIPEVRKRILCEFRHSQNWFGSHGSTLNNARYIPPNVDDMNQAMSNFEKYMNYLAIVDRVGKTKVYAYNDYLDILR